MIKDSYHYSSGDEKIIVLTESLEESDFEDSDFSVCVERLDVKKEIKKEDTQSSEDNKSVKSQDSEKSREDTCRKDIRIKAESDSSTTSHDESQCMDYKMSSSSYVTKFLKDALALQRHIDSYVWLCDLHLKENSPDIIIVKVIASTASTLADLGVRCLVHLQQTIRQHRDEATGNESIIKTATGAVYRRASKTTKRRRYEEALIHRAGSTLRIEKLSELIDKSSSILSPHPSSARKRRLSASAGILLRSFTATRDWYR